MIRSKLPFTGLIALMGMAWSTGASAITLDFETDEFGMPMIDGQIIDPAIDPVDLEFGTGLVTITSRQLTPPDGHLGVTVFDSNTPDAQDPDLVVGLGNVLILQNDASPSTSVDPVVGLIYDTPNDEATVSDAGAIVFDFATPVFLQSIDLIDINGGVRSEVTLTDTAGLTRTYSLPNKWSNDIVDSGPAGFDTLLLDTLLPQEGEGIGGPALATEDPGFDPFLVVNLDVTFEGRSPSGALDNLVFVPEPTSVVLALGGALLFVGRRRRC
ncbi:MAG: PEP-CTERM sorting domain-containing protein [Planctomycetota bacterium]